MSVDKHDLRRLLDRGFGLAPGTADPAAPEATASPDAVRLAAALDGALRTPVAPPVAEEHVELAAIRSRAEGLSSWRARAVVVPLPVRRRRRWLAAGTAVAAALPVLLLSGLLAPPAAEVEVALSVGRPSSAGGAALARGDRLRVPATLTTDAADGLVVGSAGARVQLAPSTTLRLERATADTVACRLERGLASFDFSGGAGRSLTVTTADATVRVTGTWFAVEAILGGSKVSVGRGSVSVTTRLTQGVVTAGQSCRVVDGLLRYQSDKQAQDDARDVELRLDPSGALGRTNDAPRTNAAVRPATKKPAVTDAKPAVVRERVYLKDGTVVTGRILLRDADRIRVESALGVIDVPTAKCLRVERVP